MKPLTRPGAAFPNGTSYQIWQANWCDRCAKDAEFQAGRSDEGCGLLLTALLGEETPAEWMETEEGCADAYRCIEFRSTEDGGEDPEPKPLPDPPLMDALFDAPPRRTRMFVNPAMSPTEVF